MAANYRNDARETNNGPRGPRYTMPLAPDTPPALPHLPPIEPGSLPLSEDTEIPIRNTCWRCGGRKTLDDVGYVRCDVPECRKRCELDRITNHGHGRRDVWVLACGHAQHSEFLDVQYMPCPECGGAGILRGYKRLGDMLDWLDEQYPTISQAITAVLAAIRGKAI